MSGVAGPTTKKRKKPDAKPQSQINKCLNEKRRREQENLYIEELAELISASFADMNSLSVKPDKCAILQETVNQIRHIKQQEQRSGGDAAVQQGEVSSSNPTILRNEVFGPLLLEALDGFLFVVNLDTKIEFVTENVRNFIRFNREDLINRSIYNFIHHGDHSRFSSSLLPMSMTWSDQSSQNCRKTFECRLLVKPPDDQDSTMEEKQQRVTKYENMQIQCTQVQLNRDKGELGDSDDVTSESGDNGLSLMCVARRMPQNEKTVGTPLEQFTTKLDPSGKIIGIDTFGVSAIYSQYLNKDLMGQVIMALVHPLDMSKLSDHLKDALSNKVANSASYRIRVGSPDKFIRVRTTSKFFKGNVSLHEPEYIMATHSIIGDLDVASPESAVTSPPSSTSVGGPLMSGSNGGNTGGLSLSNHYTYDLGLSEIGELFPTSTSWDTSEHGDSRASLTPSRPPSISAYSPVPATSFPYSPSPFHEEEKESKEEPQDSGRLRNLLTQRASFEEEPPERVAAGKNVILKQLLKEQDSDDGGERPQNGRVCPPPSVNNNNNNNHMLLKLLNDKPDDDDSDRADLRKQNELLQTLLKEQTDKAASSQDDLFKSVGFRNPSPSSPHQSSLIGNRKRPSDEGEGPGGKRPDNGSGVSSTGKSKLWEKNQMLASLLARDSPKTTTIPPIPTSVISGTPQDKLPKIGKIQAGQWQDSNMQSPVQGGAPGRPPGQQSAGKPQRVPTQFLNQMLSHPQDPQSAQLAKQLQERVVVNQGNVSQIWAIPGDQSDPVLSDLLDQVIDIVPDAICTDSSQIINLLDQMNAAQPPNQTMFRAAELQERLAISEIQKSLMMCETAVKSPSSPTPYTSPPNQPPGFPPPPMYQQAAGRARFAARPQQFPANPQQQVLMQRKLMADQQKQQLQHKQRLLQAQQQQQMLIPSNAAADPSMNNMETLLNNTVAPNVSLQRSSSVSESQLSPSYSNQVLSNGGPISSPHPHSPQGWATPNQARLSPHTPSQLSPRITQGQQTGYTVTSPGQQPTSWQQNNRLMQQQQQNPMLNAQLQGGYGNGGGRFTGQARAGQPGRTLASPGPGPRQSPFPADAFPPPVSPTGYQPQYSPQQQQQQQQQQMRLQRSVSTPTATTQLPGGPATPRHYGYGKEMPRTHPHQHPYSPYNSYPTYPSPDQMMYQPQPSHDYYDQMYARAPPLQSTDYVRQELKAMVGARTQQLAPPASPRQIQQMSAADLEALGLSFEMPSGPSESPKMWGSMGAEMGATSPQSGISNRGTGMEDSQRTGEQKSSLLQKLLSE